MKTFTIDDIRAFRPKPCYDPSRYLAEDWQGTALDVLRHANIPDRDKLWVVCREALIDDKTLRLFAVWCARRVEHLLTDERSRNAIDIAEKYAHKQATQEELEAAQKTAQEAEQEAARVVAARQVTGVTAWVVAARYAAVAACLTARIAAWEAQKAAQEEAADARKAERAAQIAQLIKMLEGEMVEKAKEG